MKLMLTVEQLKMILNGYLEDSDLLSIDDFQEMLEEYGQWYSPEGWDIDD